MGRHRSALLVGVIAVPLLGAAITAPAQATLVERTKYSGSDAWLDTSCGIAVDVQVTWSGQFTLRAGKGPDATAYLGADNFAWFETHTEKATGISYTVAANSMWREIKATRVDDNVFEFTQIQPGQSFVVRDSSGKVVLRDRGNLVFHYAIDTGGDTSPDSQFVDFYGVDTHGPHDGFGVDLCKVQAGLLRGTGSAAYANPRPVGTTDANLGYYEYLPPSYSSSGGTSPLVVFLHGYGESGEGTLDGLKAITGGGIPFLIDNNGWPTDRPFVVLAPQHPYGAQDPSYPDCEGQPFGGSCWMASQYAEGDPPGSPFMGADQVHDFISYAVSHYNVDPHRVYLTGLSAGAYGTWAYAARWATSGQVAAMVPIAGDGRPAWDDAGCAMSLPTWAFHGELDDLINPLGSTETVTHLQSCPGADAQVTTYPDLWHEPAVWNGTYNSLEAPVDIYDWFLAHSTT